MSAWEWRTSPGRKGPGMGSRAAIPAPGGARARGGSWAYGPVWRGEGVMSWPTEGLEATRGRIQGLQINSEVTTHMRHVYCSTCLIELLSVLAILAI